MDVNNEQNPRLKELKDKQNRTPDEDQELQQLVAKDKESKTSSTAENDTSDSATVAAQKDGSTASQHSAR